MAVATEVIEENLKRILCINPTSDSLKPAVTQNFQANFLLNGINKTDRVVSRERSPLLPTPGLLSTPQPLLPTPQSSRFPKEKKDKNYYVNSSRGGQKKKYSRKGDRQADEYNSRPPSRKIHESSNVQPILDLSNSKTDAVSESSSQGPGLTNELPNPESSAKSFTDGPIVADVSEGSNLNNQEMIFTVTTVPVLERIATDFSRASGVDFSKNAFPDTRATPPVAKVDQEMSPEPSHSETMIWESEKEDVKHCEHCMEEKPSSNHVCPSTAVIDGKRLLFNPSTLQGESELQAREDTVERFLWAIHKEEHIPSDEYQRRQDIFKMLLNILESNFPKSEPKMYGSTVTLAGLLTSDLNITVVVEKPKEDMKTIATLIETEFSGLVSDVNVEQRSSVPRLTMNWTDEGEEPVRVVVSAGCEVYAKTSELLRRYSLLDRRVVLLTVCLRVWAKMCGLDNPEEGTLPAHVFHIMVIYFLQRQNILAVCHKEKEKVAGTGEENDDIAEDAVEDNFPDDDVSTPLVPSQEKWNQKKYAPEETLGRLWVKLLDFYAEEFNFREDVIMIASRKRVPKKSLSWRTNHMICILDPLNSRRNCARTMSHQKVHDYFYEQLAEMNFRFKRYYTLYDSDDRLQANNYVHFFLEKKPPKVCTVCQKIGHFRSSCPEEVIDPIQPLNPPDPKLTWVMDKVLKAVIRENEQTEQEIRDKDHIKNDIESFIEVVFPDMPKPILTLFGSSCNGFGFRKSDLDLSLSFENQGPYQSQACIDIINRLAAALSQERRYQNVTPITTAKVPIVKFSMGDFECDICLYNTLAQHNTKLLATYADLDKRVRPVGYAVKFLAKVCQICDASKGSLSSYAYTLMAIYFLQRVDPPVLPVLQEDSNDNNLIEVEGWNVWFNRNVEPPWSSKNRWSAGRLFLEMVEFYSSSFDYDSDVVSIRKKERLTKAEKNWECRGGIAIEDPFNLDHNLGVRLSVKMSIYIRRVFREARLVFRQKEFIDAVVRLDVVRCCYIEDLLFQRKLIYNGPPANSHGCRYCWKIGHFINDCPTLPKNRKKEMAAKERANSESAANSEPCDRDSSTSQDLASPVKKNGPKAEKIASSDGNFRKRNNKNNSNSSEEKVLSQQQLILQALKQSLRMPQEQQQRQGPVQHPHQAQRSFYRQQHHLQQNPALASQHPQKNQPPQQNHPAMSKPMVIYPSQQRMEFPQNMLVRPNFPYQQNPMSQFPLFHQQQQRPAQIASAQHPFRPPQGPAHQTTAAGLTIPSSNAVYHEADYGKRDPRFMNSFFPKFS